MLSPEKPRHKRPRLLSPLSFKLRHTRLKQTDTVSKCGSDSMIQGIYSVHMLLIIAQSGSFLLKTFPLIHKMDIIPQDGEYYHIVSYIFVYYLYYLILPYIIIYYPILSYIIPHYPILSYIIPYCHILSYTILYSSILSYIIVYYYISLYIIIYSRI